MAVNPLVPFGFRVANQYGSSPPNFQTNSRSIAYNNSNKIAWGDPVKSISTGYIDLMATGGTTIHGILDRVFYPNPLQIGGVSFLPYWPATSGLASTTVVTAHVYNDPTTVFMAQVNGAAVTVASIGLNIDITTSTSGAPNAAGYSTCSLLSSSIQNTATLPFRIVGIVATGGGPFPNYDATLDNNCVFVKMNTSDLLATTGI